MREYTVTEVADLLRVNRVTVWQWIRDGKMEARKSGLGETSPYKISESELKRVARELGLSLNLK